MMIADDGDLIILAPGLKQFGEDPTNDKLIRKYGYKGTPATLKAVAENEDLRQNLGAAAHLIHGSSEGRFRITYCPGKNITKEEVANVGFLVEDCDKMAQRRSAFSTADRSTRKTRRSCSASRTSTAAWSAARP